MSCAGRPCSHVARWLSPFPDPVVPRSPIPLFPDRELAGWPIVRWLIPIPSRKLAGVALYRELPRLSVASASSASRRTSL